MSQIPFAGNRYLVLALLALAACQTPGAGSTETDQPIATPVTNVSDPAVDRAADRAAIEALTASYQAADRAGDHAAIAALYADDAVIHPEGKPAVHGREALDAYFAANDSEPEDITFTTVDVVVSDAGDMAYEVGTTASPDGPSKYLTVYRKIDGRWLIVGDTWSSDAPPPGGTNS
jgi:uncharacterized protein (TIGR02246 family)